jgi:acyl-CoA thioesterase
MLLRGDLTVQRFGESAKSRAEVIAEVREVIAEAREVIAEAREVIAEAREVSKSLKLASFEVNVRNQSGDLLAAFQGMVYRKPAQLESLMTEPL